MHKTFLSLGTILAGLGVILGAFGAHGLKKYVGPDVIATYQTGVQYQMYHAFALLLAGILYERFGGSALNWAGWLFLGGIVLFSGSLYALVALKATNQVGLRGIGAITPLGGLLFIGGWIALLVGILRR
ncbi:DUF423 domain-containing protein [Flaviaesturariibacter flavus]|uniref:DUF423 domain-containing protein n=1 Tax=Flaviaesturariibacter flavus TaxID=2502780 RepID=A0A4R1BJG1_9BACT|nr:DUF423 domain-containing protein [Flaviaesturariibacter flavus]TCJ17470.1 DUF423 domain-containing protein [Flaviaesturariibacter flavus]